MTGVRGSHSLLHGPRFVGYAALKLRHTPRGIQPSKVPDVGARELGGLRLNYRCLLMVRVQNAWGMWLLHEVTNIKDGLDRTTLEDF